LFLRYRSFLKKKIDGVENKARNTANITIKYGLFKLVVTAFLVCLTLSLFLTSISYALPGRAGVGIGDKGVGFPSQSPPLGLQRPNNAGPGNNLGAFSNMERSPALPNIGSPPGAAPILHPSTNGGGTPAALGGLQQQQQHQQSLINAPPSNTRNVVNPNGCPTVVQPNGADTTIAHPSNCSVPSNSVVHPSNNNSPTDSRVIHANNNCVAVVHPNGADTKVVNSNNCPTGTSGHVTVNSGGTSSSSSSSGSSSSSSLTVNNVQGSNSGASQSSSTNTNTNAIPVADAGPNQKVHTSDHVILDGSKSSDPSGGPLKFSWLQLAGGQVVSLSNHDKAKATFIAPTVTAPTILTFQLIVNNENGSSAPSYVSVTVLP
jgi:hypothetical protein